MDQQAHIGQQQDVWLAQSTSVYGGGTSVFEITHIYKIIGEVSRYANFRKQGFST